MAPSLRKFFPFLAWLPHYQRQDLKGDLSAGLTVGIMLIPQGMAYAYIAGLPPVYGLYAALVPQVIYAFLGTSRQLSVGPVAMDSLLVAAGVSALAQPGSSLYLSLAILLAFMMGAIQFLLGIFRLGFLVNFLSRPVISGFTSAAAIIIGLSQLKHLLGISLAQSNQVQYLLAEALMKMPQTHLPTLSIGLGTVFLLQGIGTLNKNYRWAIPAPLVAVGLCTALAGLGQWHQLGVHIVGDIPSGLPRFIEPDWSSIYWADLFPLALTLALIAFMEAISVAKALEARHQHYQVEANQELIALGAANLGGAFFQCYPTTGGFSRSAVNDQAGAKTGLAAWFAAGLIALTLLFLTPLFYYLPQSALAAIILMAVFRLIEVRFPLRLWKEQKSELAMLLATFLITLLIGIREGILIGVALSLGLVIYQSTRPHWAVLGRIPGTRVYRNVARHPEVEVQPEVLVFRYDAALYFANLNHFKETLLAQIAQKGPSLRVVILHAESISSLDSSALEMLRKMVQSFQRQGIVFMLTGLIGPVRDSLHRSGLLALVEAQNVFLEVQDALDGLEGLNGKNPWQRFAVQTNANL